MYEYKVLQQVVFCYNIIMFIVFQDAYHLSSSVLSNGSSEHMVPTDEVDAHGNVVSDLARTRAAIEHMQSKIGRTKELIRGEQTTRDGNFRF